jgi:hypothetical protein
LTSSVDTPTGGQNNLNHLIIFHDYRRLSESAKADIKESEEEVKRLEENLRQLMEEVKNNTQAITDKWESVIEENEILELKPRRTDVHITLVAPAWVPVYVILKSDGAPPVKITAWNSVDSLEKP